MGEWLSQQVTEFRGRPLPVEGAPAGYAALIAQFELSVPLPARLAAIGVTHHPPVTEAWLMLTPRHAPEPSLAGHIGFAFRYEGVDLQILAKLFQAVPAADIQAVVAAVPTGGVSRRLWFLYEWLTGNRLDVPDPGKVKAVPVLDLERQYGLRVGDPSPRHKVINNLPGVPAFCPLVRRTPAMAAAEGQALDERARQAMGRIRPDLLARAAAFMLLNDSKSSFAIEGEKPSGQRAARWGQAIAQAGTRPLDVAEFNRLQRVVIGDARFVRLGLRQEGGFVGVHDRDTNMPVPDHISARHEDLNELMDGLIAFGERSARGGLDPVVAAACLAFGFIYIHPYVDGNGRLHRWLIHHALAAAGYTPKGLVFPISSAILRQLDRYRTVLESYSAPLMPCIDWRPTDGGNVEVLNQTADFYRYFDATQHAVFLYDCVEQTIGHDLPEEVRFLEAFDAFGNAVQQVVDLPAGKVEMLRKFLAQNEGRFSQRAREREFAAFTTEEVSRVEAIYAEAFGDDAR